MLGLLRRLDRVFRDPRVVLADVRHLEEELVEAAVRHCLAEGGLVHGGRTGGDDHAVDAELLDVVLDEHLARVLVLARLGHARKRGGELDDLGDVDLAGDVAAAVADVDADLQIVAVMSHSSLLLARRAHAGTAASTASTGMSCFSSARSLGSHPSA